MTISPSEPGALMSFYPQLYKGIRSQDEENLFLLVNLNPSNRILQTM